MRAPVIQRGLHIKMKCKGSHLGTVNLKCIIRQQVRRRKLKLMAVTHGPLIQSVTEKYKHGLESKRRVVSSEARRALAPLT